MICDDMHIIILSGCELDKNHVITIANHERFFYSLSQDICAAHLGNF